MKLLYHPDEQYRDRGVIACDHVRKPGVVLDERQRAELDVHVRHAAAMGLRGSTNTQQTAPTK